MSAVALAHVKSSLLIKMVTWRAYLAKKTLSSAAALPAADDKDFLVSKKFTIAGSTVGDAMSRGMPLPLKIPPALVLPQLLVGRRNRTILLCWS